MMKRETLVDRTGYGLLFVGLVALLYGLLGGPTAEMGLIGLGAGMLVVGSVLLLRPKT